MRGENMAERFDQWAEQAARQIRFRPDRAAVERELRDHMEDRKQSCLEEMDEAAAVAAVLRAMGDAETVGRALNHVHTPWLGYGWLLSKIAAIIMVVIAGASLLFNLHDDVVRSLHWWQRNEEDYCGSLHDTSVPVAEGLTFEEDAYRIRLDHGTLERADYWQRLTLGLEVWGYEPWLQYPGGLGNITVEDSLGGVYTIRTSEQEGQGTCLVHLSMAQAWELPWWRGHIVIEYLPWDLENSPYPQWQRITIENTDIAFTVWENGEVYREP